MRTGPETATANIVASMLEMVIQEMNVAKISALSKLFHPGLSTRGHDKAQEKL